MEQISPLLIECRICKVHRKIERHTGRHELRIAWIGYILVSGNCLMNCFIDRKLCKHKLDNCSGGLRLLVVRMFGVSLLDTGNTNAVHRNTNGWATWNLRGQLGNRIIIAEARVRRGKLLSFTRKKSAVVGTIRWG